MTVSLDVNNLKIDNDDTNDHVTFRVIQTGEQSFSVRTFVDTSKDGFGKLNSDMTKTFAIDTPPNWHLSSLKFEGNKLILLGQDGTSESLALSQLIPGTTDKVAIEKQQLDKEIRENAGVLGALRDDATLDSNLGATGLNADMLNGIGGLIGSKGQQIGSGGLGAQSSDLGGGGTAHGDPIILGALDKSLVDAVIKHNMAQVRYCYQKELTSNPTLKGKITIKLVIARDGSVSSATVKTNEMNLSEVGQRVGEAICAIFMKFQFPEPKGGGIVIVSYPFEFSPG